MWKTVDAKNFRKPESLMKKLNMLEKKYPGEISIDHGIANYRYHHYEYEPATCDNGFVSSLTVYVEDFNNNDKVIPYMTVTEENLRKPTAADREYGVKGDLIECYWEKQFPSIIVMFEYDPRPRL